MGRAESAKARGREQAQGRLASVEERISGYLYPNLREKSSAAMPAPSAREWFPVLRERLLASRPVLEQPKVVPVSRKDGEQKRDADGVPFWTQTAGRYLAPLFRNTVRALTGRGA